MIEAAMQQFYADQSRRRRSTCRCAPAEQELLEDWLGAEVDRKVRIVVPQRGDKKGMMELAHRNAALAYRHALRRERDRELRGARIPAGGAAAAEAAAAHRLLRHLDHPGQRDGRVDGGVRRRADEARASTASSEIKTGTGNRHRAEEPQARPGSTGFWMTLPRWSKSCGGAIRKCWKTAGRFRI